MNQITSSTDLKKNICKRCNSVMISENVIKTRIKAGCKLISHCQVCSKFKRYTFQSKRKKEKSSHNGTDIISNSTQLNFQQEIVK